VDDGTATIECAFRPDDEEKSGNKKLADKPPPLVPVGSVVKVQGKVRAKHDSRDIHGESIGLCFLLYDFA
jgi:hypothetical protein